MSHTPRHLRPILRRCLLALAAIGIASMPAAAPPVRAEEVPRSVAFAVSRGLDFLAKTQNKATGGWSVRGAGGGGDSPAMTSLAVMAFMAHGETPGQGPYGDVINRGIDYVLSCQAADGIISRAADRHTMYEHGISTVMLTEAYGMVDEARRPRVQAAVAKAVRVILLSQRASRGVHAGGWRYTPYEGDADISVTGWQLMALRGAGNAGAPIPRKALEDGIAYIKRCAGPSGGFGYTAGSGDATPARTGTGVVALSLLGQYDAPEIRTAASYLRTNRITASTPWYFYAVYYCSQAAQQLGGEDVARINEPIRTTLLNAQRRDGSWGGAGQMESNIGETYCTAMALLALQVPYRYLPLYQR